MAESEFSVMLFKLGVKLILKKTQMLGSNEAFIRHHMKSLKESVTSGLRVIPAKDVLVYQMVIMMRKGRVQKMPADQTRSLIFYTKFLSDIPKTFVRKDYKLEDGSKVGIVCPI
jgi:hypothetical protein